MPASTAQSWCGKLYESAAGVRLAPLARLGSFQLSQPAVQAKLRERYGTQVPVN